VVVVVVDEPFVPLVPLDCCVVVFVVLRDVPVTLQGCQTKSAINATTTMTATKLKAASDPPSSRETEMLRSSMLSPKYVPLYVYPSSSRCTPR
jgi:hypothetical protein